MKAIYLRTRRERLGLTQEELSSKSKVAQNTISKYESNPNARPVFDFVVALAVALGVADPRQLRFGPDPRRRPIAARTRARGKKAA